MDSKLLVSTQWLAEHINDDNLIIVDCQWDANAYIRAHIPGALMRPGHPFVKSEPDGKLTNLMPTAKECSSLMHQLGIDQNSLVICYDEWENHFATRLWWVLRYYGFHNVKLLDGGWQAWVAAGHSVSFVGAKAQPKTSHFEIQPNTSLKTDLQEVIAHLEHPDWQILDVRSDVEFNGKNLAENKRGGHIPDAKHLEWKRLLTHEDTDGGVNYFRSKDEMEKLLAEAGVQKDKTVAVHCQSGIRASFMVFCLEMLDYPNVKLYDGSMKEWANLDDTPLEL